MDVPINNGPAIAAVSKYCRTLLWARYAARLQVKCTTLRSKPRKPTLHGSLPPSENRSVSSSIQAARRPPRSPCAHRPCPPTHASASIQTTRPPRPPATTAVAKIRCRRPCEPSGAKPTSNSLLSNLRDGFFIRRRPRRVTTMDYPAREQQRKNHCEGCVNSRGNKPWMRRLCDF